MIKAFFIGLVLGVIYQVNSDLKMLNQAMAHNQIKTTVVVEKIAIASIDDSEAE